MVARIFTPARGIEDRYVTPQVLEELEQKYIALCEKVPSGVELSDSVFAGVCGFDHTAATRFRNGVRLNEDGTESKVKRISVFDKASAEAIRDAVRAKKLQADIAELEAGFVAGVKRSAGVKANVDPAAALLALLSLPGVRDNPAVIAALKAAGLVK